MLPSKSRSRSRAKTPLDGKWQNLQYTNTLTHFALARTVSEILTIYIFDLQKVNQGH